MKPFGSYLFTTQKGFPTFPLFPCCFFKSTMLYFSIICRLSKDTPFERFADTSGKCGEKLITGEVAADKLVELTETIAEKCFADFALSGA